MAGVDLGRMAPWAACTMPGAFPEALAKVALPVVAVLGDPLWAASVSCGVCTILCLAACCCPPRRDGTINRMVRIAHGMKVAAFGAALVAVLQATGVLEISPWVAPALLYGGLASSVFAGCLAASRRQRSSYALLAPEGTRPPPGEAAPS